MARKAEFNQQVADIIIERTCEGLSLVQIANIKGVPSRPTIYKWMDENKSFADNYARARDIRADRIAEQVIEIADEEEDAAKARNRIDARKWAAGKMAPKRWGDRTIIQGTGDKDDSIHVDASVGIEMILARLAKLAGRGDE